MSETTTLFKMVVVLGIFFVFVGFLPGSSTPAAWTDFRNQLSGQDFPEYDNPFTSTKYYADTLLPRHNGEDFFGDPVPFAVNDVNSECGVPDVNTNISDCVRTNDGASSYLTTSGNFTVYLDAVPEIVPRPIVQTVIVEVWCLSDDIERQSLMVKLEAYSLSIIPEYVEGTPVNGMTPSAGDGGTGVGGLGICSVGEFKKVTFYAINENPCVDGDTGCWAYAGFTEPSVFNQVWVQTNSSHILISAVAVHINSVVPGNADGACVAPDGAWLPALDILGCQIDQAVRFTVRLITAIVNGIVYLGAVIYFGLSAAFNLVLGFFQMMGYLYAVPNAPFAVQIFLDVFVTGALVYIIFIIVKTIRGSEP